MEKTGTRTGFMGGQPLCCSEGAFGGGGLGCSSETLVSTVVDGGGGHGGGKGRGIGDVDVDNGGRGNAEITTPDLVEGTRAGIITFLVADSDEGESQTIRSRALELMDDKLRAAVKSASLQGRFNVITFVRRVDTATLIISNDLGGHPEGSEASVFIKTELKRLEDSGALDDDIETKKQKLKDRLIRLHVDAWKDFINDVRMALSATVRDFSVIIHTGHDLDDVKRVCPDLVNDPSVVGVVDRYDLANGLKPIFKKLGLIDDSSENSEDNRVADSTVFIEEELEGEDDNHPQDHPTPIDLRMPEGTSWEQSFESGEFGRLWPEVTGDDPDKRMGIVGPWICKSIDHQIKRLREAGEKRPVRVIIMGGERGWEAKYLLQKYSDEEIELTINERDRELREDLKEYIGPELLSRVNITECLWQDMDKESEGGYDLAIWIGNKMDCLLPLEKRKEVIGNVNTILNPGGEVLVDFLNDEVVREERNSLYKGDDIGDTRRNSGHPFYFGKTKRFFTSIHREKGEDRMVSCNCRNESGDHVLLMGLSDRKDVHRWFTESGLIPQEYFADCESIQIAEEGADGIESLSDAVLTTEANFIGGRFKKPEEINEEISNKAA